MQTASYGAAGKETRERRIKEYVKLSYRLKGHRFVLSMLRCYNIDLNALRSLQLCSVFGLLKLWVNVIEIKICLYSVLKLQQIITKFVLIEKWCALYRQFWLLFNKDTCTYEKLTLF